MNMSADTVARADSDSASSLGRRFFLNAHGLLALSLVPAWLGVVLGGRLRISDGITGVVGLVLLLLGAYGFSSALAKARQARQARPAMLSAMAFTFFAGLMSWLVWVRVLGFYRTTVLLSVIVISLVVILLGVGVLSALLQREPGPVAQTAISAVVVLAAAGVSQAVLLLGAVPVVLGATVVALLAALLLREVRRAARSGQVGGTAVAGVYLNLFSLFEGLSVLLWRRRGVERL
jgi:FtsH-binding integral membrane protein